METLSTKIKSRKKVQDYVGVSQIVNEHGHIYYGAALSSDMLPTLFRDARKAAIFIDKLLIKAGKEPVNVLRRAV